MAIVGTALEREYPLALAVLEIVSHHPCVAAEGDGAVNDEEVCTEVVGNVRERVPNELVVDGDRHTLVAHCRCVVCHTSASALVVRSVHLAHEDSPLLVILAHPIEVGFESLAKGDKALAVDGESRSREVGVVGRCEGGRHYVAELDARKVVPCCGHELDRLIDKGVANAAATRLLRDGRGDRHIVAVSAIVNVVTYGEVYHRRRLDVDRYATLTHKRVVVGEVVRGGDKRPVAMVYAENCHYFARVNLVVLPM